MKHLVWKLIPCFCLLLTGCGLFSDSGRQMEDARAAMGRGDYGTAVITLRNLLERDSESAEARLLLARALFKQGDAAGADRVLQTAVDRSAPPAEVADIQARWKLASGDFQGLIDAINDPDAPFDPAGRDYYRARAFQGMGRLPEAMSIYRDLAIRQPDSADLHLRMAQIHAYYGRIAPADSALEKVLASRVPSGEESVSAEAWLLKASLAQRAGDPQAARDALAEAIDAAPGQLTAPQWGQLLASAVDRALLAGDLGAATKYQAMLVKVLPQAPLTRLVAAKMGLFGDERAKAISDLQTLLQQEPQAATATRTLLIAGQLRGGLFEQALKESSTLMAGSSEGRESRQLQQMIRSAFEHPADSADRAIGVAAVLSGLDQVALARRHLEEVPQEIASSLPLQVALVRLELRADRVAKASQLALKLAAEHPQERALSMLLADTQVAKGDFAAAATTYENVWRASPDGPVVMALAQARRRAALPDAEVPLQEWLKTHPRDVAIRLELASALQQKGDDVAAMRELERVIADAPLHHPMRPIALNNLAVLYSRHGDGRAMEIAKRAYEGARAVPAVQDTYGWLLARQGRVQEALPLLKAAADNSPTSPEIRYHYAHCLASGGEKEAARILLTDVLQDPNDFEGKSEAERLLASL